MAIERGYRFPIEQDAAFPRGLVLMGEIEPDNEYQSAEDRGRNRPVVQRKDERTGKLIWKATLTDPSEARSKRASFDVRFVAAVQPVPTTDEAIPNTGMRPIELEGLEVEPKVAGQGEFKYLTYDVWATGIKDNGRGRKSGGSSGSASAPAAA